MAERTVAQRVALERSCIGSRCCGGRCARAISYEKAGDHRPAFEGEEVQAWIEKRRR